MGKKRGSKHPEKLQVELCPSCGCQTVINKWEAYRTFHSKKYAKLRKAKKGKGPQVGNHNDPGGYFINLRFAELLAPPKNQSLPNFLDKYDKRINVCLWLLGGVSIAFPIVYGFERDEVDSRILFLLLSAIFLGLISRLSNWYDDRRWAVHWEAQEQYKHTWLCLRCSHQWLEK